MHFHIEGSTFSGSSLDSFAILHQHRQITLHGVSTESNKLAWTMDHANKHLWRHQEVKIKSLSQRRKSCWQQCSEYSGGQDGLRQPVDS